MAKDRDGARTWINLSLRSPSDGTERNGANVILHRDLYVHSVVGNGQTIHAPRSRDVVGNGQLRGRPKGRERTCPDVLWLRHRGTLSCRVPTARRVPFWGIAKATKDSERKASEEDEVDVW